MRFEKFNFDFNTLVPLLDGYKKEIGENPLEIQQLSALRVAIEKDEIVFFVAKHNENLIAMCSISKTFSTFKCSYSGVFEDFYIIPEYRKEGVAKRLLDFVFGYCKNEKISSLWVGCADCDIDMYKHLGFDIPLGNLFTWSN